MATIDWEAVEKDFRAGQLSIRSMADKHGTKSSTIQSRAKKEGWQRSASGKGRQDKIEKLARTVSHTAIAQTGVCETASEADKIHRSDNLNPQQARFVVEYLIDLNATQAAIRAGYSSDSAQHIGYQLLQKTPVKKAIQEQMNARSSRTLVTADRVITEIAKLAFSNTKNLYKPDGSLIPVHELPDDVAATIIEIKHKVLRAPDSGGNDGMVDEFTYKTADKKSSLELLAKHLRLLSDKPDTGSGKAVPRVINIGVEDASRPEIDAEYSPV